MNQPGPRELAFRHPGLRQGTTNSVPLFTMQTVNGDNAAGDRDIIFGAGRVSAQRLDAAGATGLSSAPGNPASRLTDHIAPINATGPSAGGRSTGQPEARHPVSMKASDRVEVMKRFMFPGERCPVTATEAEAEDQAEAEEFDPSAATDYLARWLEASAAADRWHRWANAAKLAEDIPLLEAAEAEAAEATHEAWKAKQGPEQDWAAIDAELAERYG